MAKRFLDLFGNKEGESVTSTLNGRRVIVTGALGGIGIEVVKKLNQLGAHILAVDLSPASEGDSILLQNHITNSRYFSVDINEEVQIQNFVAENISDLPDSLVALAGIVRSGNLAEQNSTDIKSVIETNLTSQAILTQHLLNAWITNKVKANIVYVSSWVDSVPWPGITSYTSSKAGLVALCRGVARENAKYGIRANLIAPGIVDVGMAAKQWREEPEYKKRASRAIPLGRLQKPEEVAEGIAFLLGEAAQYMTGSRLLMDGGASLYPLDPEDID
jgi:NAD(P)-dependent dehydrogenase (short-subunit alcohol dehydrogenase family)